MTSLRRPWLTRDGIRELLLQRLKQLGKYDRHPLCREFVNESAVRKLIKEVLGE